MAPTGERARLPYTKSSTSLSKSPADCGFVSLQPLDIKAKKDAASAATRRSWRMIPSTAEYMPPRATRWRTRVEMVPDFVTPQCGRRDVLLPGGLGQRQLRSWLDLDAVRLVRNLAQILDRMQRLAGRVE